MSKHEDEGTILSTSQVDSADSLQAERKDGTPTPGLAAVTSVSQWRILETQVGGHKLSHDEKKLGMVDLGNGCLMKSLQKPPRGERELSFYQRVFDPVCTDPDLLQLRTFLPAFYGTEKIDGVTFLKLENLTSGFLQPCVMDLKMGRVTYDQEATPEKIQHEVMKYPPLDQLGFQITGMMVYNPEKAASEKFGSSYGRQLTEKNIVQNGLGKFFQHQRDRGLNNSAYIHLVLSKLTRLESWFLRQKRFSFIASSILIVYEGSKLINKTSDLLVLNNINKRGHDTGGHNCCLAEEDSTVGKRVDISPTSFSQELCNHSLLPQKRPHGRLEYCEGDESSQTKRPHGPVVDSGKSLSKTAEEVDSTHMPGLTESKKVEVRLIDFAHAFPTRDIDHNFLFGLQKLMDCLRSLVS